MKAAMNPELTEALRWFTREKEIMSGMLLACGAGGRTEYAMDGEVREDSVFDLASLTKLFTGLCAMKLKEEGLLETSRSVFSYDPRFAQLREVTVEQIMGFTAELKTPGRVDACRSREEALDCLFGTAHVGEPKGRAYSDIPSMVLKYVIEAASGLNFMDCVRKTVLEPAGMRETWALVPEERRNDCQRYDGEYRIEGEKYIHRTGPEPGVPHDPKAAVIQGGTEDLCGHAGLFSTGGDMVRFCRAVLDGKIVSRASLREMAENRTGYLRKDGTYTQYLGYCCYRRHPDQYYSEIPAHMSDAAFGIGGFTGNHFSVDPGTGRYTVMLGNRVRDRLTVLLPPEGRRREDYGLRADGTGEIRWRDGTVHPSSVNYVHQKDEHLHAVIARMLTREEGE